MSEKTPSHLRVKNINDEYWLLATFNNISVVSWTSLLFVGKTGIPGENHRPVASH